jgi:biopolymer transport protein ExbD
MKIPQNRIPGDVGFNMTPMIDIVFQLIIFFLVSSHLAHQEAQMKLALPTARSGEEPPDDEASRHAPRLTINIRPDGQTSLGTDVVNADELTERLKAKLDGGGSKMEVRIRCDRAAPYRTVEPVLLSCAKANVWNVTIAVYRPEDVKK